MYLLGDKSPATRVDKEVLWRCAMSSDFARYLWWHVLREFCPQVMTRLNVMNTYATCMTYFKKVTAEPYYCAHLLRSGRNMGSNSLIAKRHRLVSRYWSLELYFSYIIFSIYLVRIHNKLKVFNITLSWNFESSSCS